MNEPRDDQADGTAAPASVEAAPADASPVAAQPPAVVLPLDTPSDAEEMTVYKSFEQRARLAEDRLEEVMNAFRSLKSETESHRERITKNLDRRYDQRRDRLLLKFIEILDNLDRALDAAERTSAGEPLIEGLILVRTQLLQTLKDEGLERIPALGHPFDPRVAEGVAMAPVDDPERHDLVVKELQRGYMIAGRVARVARVVIGQYKAPVATEPEPIAEAPLAATADAAPDAAATPAPDDPEPTAE